MLRVGCCVKEKKSANDVKISLFCLDIFIVFVGSHMIAFCWNLCAAMLTNFKSWSCYI